MKKGLLFFTLIAIIASCTRSYYPQESRSINVSSNSRYDSVEFSALKIDKVDNNRPHFFLRNSEPFTGVAVEKLITQSGVWTYAYQVEDGYATQMELINQKGFRERYVQMSQGKLNGKTEIFHKNGNIHVEQFYKNDNPVGIWKRYNQQGELVDRVNHDSLNIIKSQRNF